MIRKSLTILSLIGLVLSVGLWGVSYFDMNYVLPTLRQKVRLAHGSVFVDWTTVPACDDFEDRVRGMTKLFFSETQSGVLCSTRLELDGMTQGSLVAFFSPGFACRGFRSMHTDWLPKHRNIGPALGHHQVRIPLCLITLLIASFTVYTFMPLHRRRKRKKLGLCLKCGYDLRASKDICPECGEEFAN